MTLVHHKFVPILVHTGCFVEMRNKLRTQKYSIVVAKIELDEEHYKQEVAISEQLEENALLVMDVSL